MRIFIYSLICFLCCFQVAFSQEQEPPKEQKPPDTTTSTSTTTNNAIPTNPEVPGLTERAVQDQIEAHHYQVGIFRLRPHITLHSGYDSNALYTKDEVIGDYFFAAIPGVAVGLKLGRSAFLSINEDLEFLYYKELEQRRDIFNTTTGMFLTGTDRSLLTVQGGYVHNKSPLNSEVDVPLKHKVVNARADFEYILTHKVKLRPSLSYNKTQFSFQDEPAFKVRDRRIITTGFGAGYLFRPKVTFTGRIYRSLVQSLRTDASQVFYGLFTGVDWNSPRFIGYLHVGYGVGRVNTGENEVHPFLFEASGDFLFGKHMKVGGVAERQIQASALADVFIRINTRAGVRFEIPLTNRFILYPNYVYGSNDYTSVTIDGERIRRDRYQTADLSVGYKLIRHLQLRTGLSYLKRTGNSRFAKERFAYLIGIAYSLD